ncbi:MAG: T9SS type A sorting domain-containing protein, partial [Candidatus Eisenbacteria sp.]|nr:T9SS type A sorting domain-containing protein [Candidatus Eisenbacteria bacterium]
ETGPIRVDFHAFGPDGNADVTLEVWDGPPDEGDLLSAASFAGTMGGGEVLTHEFGWELDEADFGSHLLSVRLVVTGDDEPLSDNVIEGIPLRVDAPELYIADHFTWPNPATDIGELNLSYRLSRKSEGSVEIRVFDLLGQQVGASVLYYSPVSENEGLLPGMNTLAWEGAQLTSGVYLYHITVYDLDGTGPADQVMGKFAIAR